MSKCAQNRTKILTLLSQRHYNQFTTITLMDSMSIKNLLYNSQNHQNTELALVYQFLHNLTYLKCTKWPTALPHANLCHASLIKSPQSL